MNLLHVCRPLNCGVFVSCDMSPWQFVNGVARYGRVIPYVVGPNEESGRYNIKQHVEYSTLLEYAETTTWWVAEGV